MAILISVPCALKKKVCSAVVSELCYNWQFGQIDHSNMFKSHMYWSIFCCILKGDLQIVSGILSLYSSLLLVFCPIDSSFPVFPSFQLCLLNAEGPAEPHLGSSSSQCSLKTPGSGLGQRAYLFCFPSLRGHCSTLLSLFVPICSVCLFPAGG